MSIDLRNETSLSVSQAARLLPPSRRGKPVSPSCVIRWILDGVKLPSGEVLYLEASRFGHRWVTSVEALERFADRQTPRIDGEPGLKLRTPTQRSKAAERAAKRLENAGI